MEGSKGIDAKYQDQKANLPLLVVMEDGPSLLGRDWLKHFKLDWSQLHHVMAGSDAGVQEVVNRGN